ASRTPVRIALAHVEKALATRAPMSEPVLMWPLTDRYYTVNSAVQWWRRQGEMMVAAIWQEARWRTSGILPDEASYLAIAEVTAAIGWTAATLLLLDGASVAPSPDGPVQTATAALAAAVRVANDLHETRREQREGKVQLLFLRTRALQALGYSRRAAQRRARQELLAELSVRAARVTRLLDDHQWGGPPRLRSGLLGILGAALKRIHAHELAAVASTASVRAPRR